MEDLKSPVDWSIIQKEELTTKQLLQLKFALTNKENELSSLELALAENSSAELVGLLLENGANPNQLNTTQIPLLHVAIETSTPGVVQAMLTADTDANIKSPSGTPALQCALESGEAAKVQSLIQAGADLFHLNSAGGNYLQTLLISGDSPDMISHLITQKLDLQHKNKAGFNVLEQAIRLKRPKATDTLISSGAKLSTNFFSKNYETPSYSLQGDCTCSRPLRTRSLRSV